MKSFFKNVFAVIRANVIFLWYSVCRRCHYKNIVRVFRWVDITVDKKGKMMVGKGVAIRERSMCTVRPKATLIMGDMSSLNADCKIVCHEKISIGENTILGSNVHIYDHDHVFDAEKGVRRKEYVSSEVVIGNNCWIGANAIILRGTHIGDNCVIGAGTIVKGDYPDGVLIVNERRTITKEIRK